MNKITLYILLIACFFKTYSAPAQNTVNALNPKKELFRKDIQKLGFRSSVTLLENTVAYFEKGKEYKVALYFNGIYHGKIAANGVFSDKLSAENITELPVDSIERLELHYDPILTIENDGHKYIGSITFIVPNSMAKVPEKARLREPDEPIDPDVKARLAEMNERKLPKIFTVAATSIPRIGVFAGSQTIRQSYYVGVPVEIPINTRLSLQAEFMYNSKVRINTISSTTGVPLPATYLLRCVEGTALVKAYLINKYPLFYMTSGPFVERAQSIWAITERDGSETKTKDSQTALGWVLGFGVQLKSGLYFSITGSTIFTPDSKLLPEQGIRGPAISIGYRFGEP